MTTPSGIEQFDGMATLAFAKLYESFPNPIDLDGSGLAAEYLKAVDDDVSKEEMFELISTTGPSTLEWLAEEGFIRYAPDQRTLSGGASHPHSRLTMRGLLALRAVPASIGPQASSDTQNERSAEVVEPKSFGEQALDAVAAGTRTGLGEFSKGVIAGVVGVFLRSGGWGP